MGCYNACCNLSNLPILCGDKVRLVLLLPDIKGRCGHPVQDSIIKSDDLFQPFSVAIKGEYDDYGCIDVDEEDPMSTHLLSFFERLQKEGRIDLGKDFPEGRYKEYGNGLLRWLKIIGYEMDFRIDISVFGKSPHFEQDWQQLMYCLVHEDVYQKAIGLLSLKVLDWHSEISYFDNIKSHADCWYNWAKKNFAAIEDNERARFTMSDIHWPASHTVIAINAALDLTPASDSEEVHNRFLGFNEDKRYNITLWSKLYYEPIYKAISDGVDTNDIRWTSFRDSLCELASVSMAMTYVIGKTWLPLQTRGQGFDPDLHERQVGFNLFCAEFINSLRKESLEEDNYIEEMMGKSP